MQARVGNYRIVGVLGAGGMGTVYRAEHLVLGRPAAIKVLLPEHVHDRDVVTRLFNEARAAAAVRHPGVVEVLDVGYLDDGGAYLLMELLPGTSLAARLAARGPLPEREALAIVRGIASVLVATHAQGVVHRDLKPDNVFLVPDPGAPGGERVKVLDFGIAKVAEAHALPLHTRTGVVLGTPVYMAPEQCRGTGAIDHRADLYAVGCILLELMSGRPPFDGDGAGAVLGAHLHLAPPRLRGRVPHASAGAEALIERLLAKHPDDRVPSASALLGVLDVVAARAPIAGAEDVTLLATPALPPPGRATLALASGLGRSPPTRGGTGPGRRTIALAAVAAALLIGAIAAGVRLQAPPGAPREPAPARPPPPASPEPAVRDLAPPPPSPDPAAPPASPDLMVRDPPPASLDPAVPPASPAPVVRDRAAPRVLDRGRSSTDG